MDFELSDEQTRIRRVAREFAETELGERIAPYDERHEFPAEIVRKLGPLGFLGVLVPEEYGGAGLGHVAYALIVEELCRGDASVGITMWAHNSLCANHVASFASAEQKRRYLPPLATGEVLGAWGLTEPGSGSDAAALRTRAELAGDHWVLNGSKAFITNASVAATAVVMVRTDPGTRSTGISAFVVEAGTPGFSAGAPYRKLGLHASNTAELIFEDARVPAANLLGERGQGFVQAMRVLEGGRIAMAAMAVGIAQAAVDQAVRYMKQRTAFGRTLAEFNGLQGMIADLATEVEVARLLTLRAAYLKDAGRPAMHAAAMAKLFASETAMKAATRAVQIHGGAGYITEFPVERIFRDAKLTEIGEGTSEIQRTVIARELLQL
ncbi:MAG: acyl-CoA dehydrogenase [Candidatus Rokubacteria bacterium RIFCSPHIGHO2_12_FULL_73_22]|nr:MAG: acyl-CoA dehydrogenase [Candidatus Rokubacteria bacterium RIFCSPHIGHO2_12_FULL_73_22]OGL01920.1 MAG: acyl-CoA dehydrogenase [Candidatus Rokubacteria bacterium RIFCSPHIGHO2_02_FULL_73_26]OGL12269.1 MAG: acyl-CoA dehydrogenase [Candidatus Rokubacteria bacterium RIFCSPLOWO2_02_FULL_73_56]OGL28255.1 MAG: acyl-CoA dehydrogenase [Candidatus Rokubacteria bacterium RIFCSPLOWO2_12_FULL_73_47]